VLWLCCLTSWVDSSAMSAVQRLLLAALLMPTLSRPCMSIQCATAFCILQCCVVSATCLITDTNHCCAGRSLAAAVSTAAGQPQAAITWHTYGCVSWLVSAHNMAARSGCAVLCRRPRSHLSPGTDRYIVLHACAHIECITASALGTYAQLPAALYEYGHKELGLCFLYIPLSCTANFLHAAGAMCC